MRAAARPFLSCLFDSPRQRTPVPHYTRASLIPTPAAGCMSTRFRSAPAIRAQRPARQVKEQIFPTHNTRRWQSSSTEPVREPSLPKTLTDSSVEERLRRVKEEYTTREIDAQRAATKAEALKKSQQEPTPKPEVKKAQENEPPSSVDVPSPHLLDPSASPLPPPLPPLASGLSTLTFASTPSEPSHFRAESVPSPPEARMPSQALLNRSRINARLNTAMERFMANVAVASHRLNAYTGTDYSGIAALRQDIRNQEAHVKSTLGAVDAAKEAYTAAFAAQATSQKEVVQLLERKHSWTAADLERYMALIRSEHLNEQAVQAAKEDLSEKERVLGETRARLERLERRQYHEEQVWSDTIRRNSTWVTFGLMGFNVVLLLTSLLLFEPWRRRRLVKEVRRVLDEKVVVPAGLAGATGVSSVVPLSPALDTEKQQRETEMAIDASVPPTDESLESIQQSTATAGNTDSGQLLPVAAASAELAPPEPATDTETILPEAPFHNTILSSPPVPEPVHDPPSRTALTDPHHPLDTTTLNLPVFWAETWADTWALYRAYWSELFSERRIAIRKVDLTATALEGAAAGAAFMGFLFVLLRPR